MAAGRTAGLAVAMVAAMPARLSFAAPPPEDPRVAEARRACAAGQVDRGVDLLASIIAESGDRNAVYNQARCYQQNGRPEEALNRFREYLRLATDEKPSELRRVERFIKELEAEVEAKAKRTPPETTPGSVVAPTETQTPATTPPVEAATQPEVSTFGGTPSSGKRNLRLASYGAAAVGAAGLATGAYFSWRVRSITKEYESPLPLINGDQEKDLRSQGDKAQTRQWIGYGVGAASLAGAAVLYWLSQDEATTPQVSFFAPFLPAGRGPGAGLSVSGRY